MIAAACEVRVTGQTCGCDHKLVNHFDTMLTQNNCKIDASLMGQLNSSQDNQLEQGLRHIVRITAGGGTLFFMRTRLMNFNPTGVTAGAPGLLSDQKTLVSNSLNMNPQKSRKNQLNRALKEELTGLFFDF